MTHVQFYGTSFYIQAIPQQIFQVFAAARQHFVPKGIAAYIAVILTDQLSRGIVDSLGYTDDDAGRLLEGIFYVLQKFFHIKIHFWQVNQERIVTFVSSGKSARGS